MNPGWRRSVLKHKPSVDNNQLTVGDYNNGGGGRYYDNQIGNSLLAAPPPGTTEPSYEVENFSYKFEIPGHSWLDYVIHGPNFGKKL